MSVLNVENVTHGFGARRILEDASFRLLKGEHVGLIGANGEGKSTFLNIITGQLTPDEGKVKITCSIGVAQKKKDEVSFDLLLSRADKALYEAKHSGRNKVIIES
jgi:ATPase subunit of ABC transporter with duplicated ATPase domains